MQFAAPVLVVSLFHTRVSGAQPVHDSTNKAKASRTTEAQVSGVQGPAESSQHFAVSEVNKKRKAERSKMTAKVKSLCHVILVLGKGCNSFTISENSSQAWFDSLRSYLELCSSWSLTTHIHAPCMHEVTLDI